MKKSESETALRALCHRWREVRGYSELPNERLSFSDFLGWVQSNYPAYLKFRTTTSVAYDAEIWFDHDFKLRWRN